MLSIFRFSTFHSIDNPIENERKIDEQALPNSVNSSQQGFIDLSF